MMKSDTPAFKILLSIFRIAFIRNQALINFSNLSSPSLLDFRKLDNLIQYMNNL